MYMYVIKLDLNWFVQLISGSPYLTASGIIVELSNDSLNGLGIHTCTNTLVVSLLAEANSIKDELTVLIADMTFTMV